MLHEIETNLYLIFLLAGAMLSVWLMQIISHNAFIVKEPIFWMHARRTALALTALGFLWAIKYCVEKAWVPWAPDLLIVGGVDLYLIVAIGSAYRHTQLRKSEA